MECKQNNSALYLFLTVISMKTDNCWKKSDADFGSMTKLHQIYIT